MTNNVIPIAPREEQPARQHYRGYSITMVPQFESTESRLARGDYRSKIIGFRYIIRPEYKAIEAEGFPDYDSAFDDACERIDALLDSL